MMYFLRLSALPFWLAVGCSVVVVLCPREGIVADWKDRLLFEAPPKWAALEGYYAKMEVSYRKIYSQVPKTFKVQLPYVVSFDIRTNGAMMVSVLRREGRWSDGKSMNSLNVYGVNSRYAFELSKTSPDTDAFLLVDYQPGNEEMRRKVHGHGKHAFSIVFEVEANGLPLNEFIKDPLVSIKSVESVRREGREMVQLDYDRRLIIRDQPGGTEHGVIILDPEHSWCVRECHFDAPTWRGDTTLEYGEDVDGFPLIRRYQDTTFYTDDIGKQIVTCEFDKLTHCEIPESEFTLSAFGLPEMQLPGEQRPRTLWRWLFGIGLGLGLLAIALRLYVKKKGHMWQRA